MELFNKKAGTEKAENEKLTGGKERLSELIRKKQANTLIANTGIGPGEVKEIKPGMEVDAASS